MTTVLTHLKISWGGTLGSPAEEIWTNSLGFQFKTDTIRADWQAGGLAKEQLQMAGLTTAIQNWYQAPISTGGTPTTATKGAGIAPSARLVWVKLNMIGPDGKYLFPANTFFYPVPIPGGGTSNPGDNFPQQPPWQMSTAITFRTGIPRGRGSHGRIYPPLAGMGPALDSPYMPETVSRQMCNNMTGLIDNINSGMGATYEPGGAANTVAGNCAIVSVGPTTGPHAGAGPLLTEILTVEVDRVPDVQRRRVDRVRRSITPAQTVTINT